MGVLIRGTMNVYERDDFDLDVGVHEDECRGRSGGDYAPGDNDDAVAGAE